MAIDLLKEHEFAPASYLERIGEPRLPKVRRAPALIAGSIVKLHVEHSSNRLVPTVDPACINPLSPTRQDLLNHQAAHEIGLLICGLDKGQITRGASRAVRVSSQTGHSFLRFPGRRYPKRVARSVPRSSDLISSCTSGSSASHMSKFAAKTNRIPTPRSTEAEHAS